MDQRTVAVAEDLPRRGSGRGSNPFGLGTAPLQPAELVEHLMKQHDQVAGLEKAVERFGVLDQGACVGDVDVDGLHLEIEG